MIYTGVGSRQTPPEIRTKMYGIAQDLAMAGWTLRSGAASGADSAFEDGAKSVNGKMEIYLPWKKFNGNTSPLFNPPPEAFTLAEQIHPAWHACSDGAKRLHARNTQQVLGQNLDSPTNLLVCWTEGGHEKGGTATAIKLARKHGARIINLAVDNWDDFWFAHNNPSDSNVGISYDDDQRSDEDPNGLEVDELRPW